MSFDPSSLRFVSNRIVLPADKSVWSQLPRVFVGSHKDAAGNRMAMAIARYASTVLSGNDRATHQSIWTRTRSYALTTFSSARTVLAGTGLRTSATDATFVSNWRSPRVYGRIAQHS